MKTEIEIAYDSLTITKARMNQILCDMVLPLEAQIRKRENMTMSERLIRDARVNLEFSFDHLSTAIGNLDAALKCEIRRENNGTNNAN